jgi:hypothetical protein
MPKCAEAGDLGTIGTALRKRKGRPEAATVVNSNVPLFRRMQMRHGDSLTQEEHR